MKSNDFISAKLAAKKSETVTVRPTVPVKKTRPAPYESRVVILRRRADGEIEEKNAAPAFLRQDPRSLVDRIVLPKDYYWRGSPDHIARREELEREKEAN
jgi:hypothetical protein